MNSDASAARITQKAIFPPWRSAGYHRDAAVPQTVRLHNRTIYPFRRRAPLATRCAAFFGVRPTFTWRRRRQWGGAPDRLHGCVPPSRRCGHAALRLPAWSDHSESNRPGCRGADLSACCADTTADCGLTSVPWQRVILRIVAAEPVLTTREIGERYAPTLRPTERPLAALHELRMLEGRNLVQRHRHTWSPALLAAVELARAA